MGRAVGAVILIISHGYKVTSANDPLVRVADAATDQLGILLAPGNFLVDTIPACKRHPLISCFPSDSSCRCYSTIRPRMGAWRRFPEDRPGMARNSI